VAEQPASGTMTGNTGAHGLDAQTGLSHVHEAHHGRPASWVAVSIIIVGFTVSGIAMVIGPSWWLFWTGAAIVVIGGIIAMSAHILDDWY
jgi:hypothetical protein